MAAAQSQQAAENQGVSTSSSAQGGVGSIQSQLDANLSFLDQYTTLSDQASIQLGKANQYGANANMFGQVASAAMSVYSNSGDISRQWNSLFKPKAPPQAGGSGYIMTPFGGG